MVTSPRLSGGPLVLFPDQSPQDISNLFSKKTYSSLLAAKRLESVASCRWTGTTSLTLVKDQEEWKLVCKRVYTTTRETKLQSFQFKNFHVGNI